MEQAVQFLRTEVSPEDLIFTDQATSFQLAHYLCDQKPVAFDSRTEDYESFRCNGLRVRSTGPNAGALTADTVRTEYLKIGYGRGLRSVWVVEGGWNIADCVARSYDLEAMEVGSVAAGSIGLAVLKRLKPFDVKLHYTDKHRLPENVEQELNLTYHADVDSMVHVCDVGTINAPLHPETENLFNDVLIGKMKRGAYLVNTARGKICDRDAVVRALKSGQLAGYAGDVWYPQPAPKDHPWRTMPHHGMTPHTSGTSLSAQARYAAGTREILECWFESRPIRDEYLIVDRGKLAGTGAHSYSVGKTV